MFAVANWKVVPCASGNLQSLQNLDEFPMGFCRWGLRWPLRNFQAKCPVLRISLNPLQIPNGEKRSRLLQQESCHGSIAKRATLRCGPGSWTCIQGRNGSKGPQNSAAWNWTAESWSALRSDSETMSSETGRRIQKLLHGIQKLLRRIQKLLLVFRNCQKLLWHIQKLLRRIQKLQVGFRVSLGIFRVSLGFNSFRVGLGFL